MPTMHDAFDGEIAQSVVDGFAEKPPIRTLLFSTLYPSDARPRHGSFVETRMRKVLATGLVHTRVVAPVPWFPFEHPVFGSYARMARTPPYERRFGVDVWHPRYVLLPKFGMHGAPLSLAVGALRTLRSLIRNGFDFDLIDAHYFYPDGVAAALLAAWLGKPFIVTARGSDLNVIGGFRLPAAQMRWAANRAVANIAVSRALANILVGWGVPSSRVHVLRNGVDCDAFQPVPIDAARAELGVQGGPMLLTVGNLVRLKRQDMAIEILSALLREFPNAVLLIVGDGPERGSLERQAARLGIASRVRFVGPVPQSSLPTYYSVADVLLLPSEQEGWPNVVLESIACGTPVVASNVGGLSEILQNTSLGTLVDSDSFGDYVEPVARLIRRSPSRDLLRDHARSMGWEATTEAQLRLFELAASGRR